MEVSNLPTAIKREREEELNLNVLASQNLVIKEEIVLPNVPSEDENKMDVDKPPVLIETRKEDPVQISMKEIEPGLVKLSVDGTEDNDDDDPKDEVTWSPEEVQKYLEDKLKEYLVDPTVNPLVELTKRSQELQEEFKEKNEEYNKLNKLFELIYRNQEKFLRYVGVLEKIPTRSVAVCADFPVIPDTIPLISKDIQESVKENMVAQIKASIPVVKSDLPAATPSVVSITKIPAQTPDASQKISKPPDVNIECIDLTDETDASSSRTITTVLKHPAPLPPRPYSAPIKKSTCLPPRPRLKVHAEERGIVLQWDVHSNSNFNLSTLSAFDIYGYQEVPNVTISTLLWKKIGSVKAMTLPMACTLTQFLEGHRYHFAIRGMDVNNRYGHFSDPISIVYTTRPKKTG